MILIIDNQRPGIQGLTGYRYVIGSLGHDIERQRLDSVCDPAHSLCLYEQVPEGAAELITGFTKCHSVLERDGDGVFDRQWWRMMKLYGPCRRDVSGRIRQ